MLPVIVAGVLTAATAYTFLGAKLISSKEAKKLIRSGKIKRVIDVRTNAEYKAGHYRGAIHIPVNKINKKTTRKLPKKGLLVYCNTGQRARYAAETLEKLGFKDVYYIAGHYSSLF
jgi:rhodanese-related sulfurtransferase